MKIALVLQGGVDRSGEYRVIPVLLALIERLAARHEVHVFALSQEPRPARWMLRGAHIHNIGSSRAVARAAAEIVREHRCGRFVLVHALWTGTSGMAATLAARLLRVPLLVHLTGGELVAKREVGYGQMLYRRWRVLNPWILRNAARVTATSAPIVALAAEWDFIAQRVPLGVDLRSWQVRAPQTRDPASPARLIQIGSLNRVKDPFTTLEAVRLLRERGREVVVDFVGEDTLACEVQAHAQRLGLARCTHFAGFRTQSHLRPMLESAHLNVVSSLHEAGPAVMLEAAVAGIPTVGTDVGHLHEWQPLAARTFPPRDAVRFATCIEELLDDETLRLGIASRAQARAVSEDADHTANLFQDLYAEVARG